MLVKALLSPILTNEALTRGLADPEARMLVEWLVDQAERLAENASAVEDALNEIHRLCRRARTIARFIHLWCYEEERGGAVQLAAVERFIWPLPTQAVDPCELMQRILIYEECEFAA
jgi:hypothetical protein